MNTERWRMLAAFLIVLFGCGGTANSQQGTRVPDGNGTGRPDIISVSDPVVLVEELKALLDKYSRPGMTDEQLRDALKGKHFVGAPGTTASDLFAFSPKLTRYVSGINSDTPTRKFRGHTYRLIPVGEFPEPDPGDRGLGVGTGAGLPRVKGREELVSRFPSVSADEIWAGSTIRLRTVLTAPSAGAYGGGTDTASEPKRNLTLLHQTHFELAFRQAQAVPLVTVEDRVFSLAADDYVTFNGAGVAVWLTDEIVGQPSPVEVAFVVKLVPPYLKTDELKWNGSPVKDHTAIRHRIYVEVEGIWLYEPGNRNVILKNFVDPARTISPYVSSVTRRPVDDGRLRILAKPGPQYTEAARANGINGTVRLRVTFLASGEIGPIEVVNGLSDGLTEQAIDAAKRMRFMPEKQNGRAVSVRKLVEFSFNLY